MLKSTELKAPTGQFRVVFVDLVPKLATGGQNDTEYYHFGDFTSLGPAIERCNQLKPGYGAAYIVYDDTGANVHEKWGMLNVTFFS